MNSHLGSRLTIVIPYYKNLSYLHSAIQSVRAQTCDKWEVIVLDDCGGDDAHDLVAGFADSRIRYVRNEINLGLARNWNKGLAFAETEFVAIFHADDMLLPNYVDEMLKLMDGYPDAAAGHCRSEIINKDGEPCWYFVDELKKIVRPKSKSDVLTIGDSGLASLMNGSWVICPTLIYRKNKIKDHSFDSKWKFMVDVDFMSKIVFGGGTIVGTKITAYRYRRHDMNQTSELTKSAVRFTEQFLFLEQINIRSRLVNWHMCSKKSKRKTGLRFHLLIQTAIYIRHRDFQLANRAIRSAFSGASRFE